MADLYLQINEDLKQSMRDKNKLKLSVLRMLITAMKNKMIDLKAEDLSDAQVIEAIKSEVKKRKDSIASYEEGGRSDLADSEKEEMEILNEYLPEQMSDDAIREIVSRVIEPIGEVSMSDFGRIMGVSVKEVAGNADGDRVSAIVKEILSAK